MDILESYIDNINRWKERIGRLNYVCVTVYAESRIVKLVGQFESARSEIQQETAGPVLTRHYFE